MPYFESDKFKLHYIENKNDIETLILLIHGGNRKLQNISSWSHNIEELQKVKTVVAVDLLGHGKSTPGSDDPAKPALLDQVSILKKFIDSTYPNFGVIIFGRSYGGAIAMTLAKSMIQKVKALVLISPAGTQFYPDSMSLHSVPTFLTWAEDDPIIPFDNTRIFEEHAKKLFSLHFEEVGKVGEEWRAHSIQSERPKEFNEAVLEFISELS